MGEKGSSLRAELERTRKENKQLRQQLLEMTIVELDLDPSKGFGRVAAHEYPMTLPISITDLKNWLITEYGSPVT